jgi:hypothetical protein
MGETKKGKKLVLVVIMLLAGALLMAGQHMAPVAAEESDVGAEVTVTEIVPESYGASIADSSRVIRSSRALEEPDSKGALMLVRGWASIELDGMVKDCHLISVWLARRGWRSAKFSVYASTDGNNWTHIGDGECTSKDYERHDFNGAFGNVRYIKIERNLWWAWSIMLLDAVYAEGGDAQQE